MAQQVARERAPDLILAEDQRRCGCGARAAASCEYASCNLCCALTHTACPRAPRAPPLPACIAGDSEFPSAAAALAAATPGATTTRAMVAAQWAAAAPGGAQRALSRAMWRARCGALEREHLEGGEVAVAAVARVHAGADALASAWLVQPPAGRSTLSEDEVACALRGRLLLAVLPAGTPCACGNAAAHNAAAALHAQDYAARNCRVGSGGVVARHNDIARAITQHARAAGAHALSEWQAARRLPLVDGRPADLALMLGFGWVALDVAQCELEGSAAMNRHALAAGRGVDFAARRHAKASRYDANIFAQLNVAYEVLPVGAPAGETDERGHALLRRIAAEIARQSGAPPGDARRALYARVSLERQRGLARTYALARLRAR